MFRRPDDAAGCFLVLTAEPTGPSSCVIASGAPDSPEHQPTFVDRALVLGERRPSTGEEASLGVVVGEGRGTLVGRGRLVGPTGPHQEVGPRRVEEVVA